MDTKSFRTHAHQLVDWMANYMETLSERPVMAQTQPSEILAQLPTQAPEQGEPFTALMQDFEQIILPGMTHWQHPRFFGYFPANSSPPSVLAEMLTATLGAQCMSWITSPAAAELEERVMEWLRTLLGLPNHWSGVIQDTASTATLCALLTAREQANGFQSNRIGLSQAPRYTVYCSQEIHSSIDKAARIAGLGTDQVRKLPVDDNLALIPSALEQAIAEDRQAGYHPLCVVAAFGTTSSTAIDPLAEIGVICAREGLWLHVDAAYAGTALVLPEVRPLLPGLDYADSFVFNPHKWMLTNFDCSAYYVRDAAALKQTFELTPEYLKTDLDKQVNNYRDWGVQLGRRFRALKLWFVLRSYGAEGIRAILRNHLAWAQELASQVDAHPAFERLAPVPFNLVCFRATPAELAPEQWDTHNEQLMRTLNNSGQLFMTHTRLQGKYTLRLVIGQTQVTHADVQAAWQQIQTTSAQLCA
jgi:aromatic-L-amino-acid decarboxylase